MSSEFLHKEVTESIIGASMKVLNTLKPELDDLQWKRIVTSDEPTTPNE